MDGEWELIFLIEINLKVEMTTIVIICLEPVDRLKINRLYLKKIDHRKKDSLQFKVKVEENH